MIAVVPSSNAGISTASDTSNLARPSSPRIPFTAVTVTVVSSKLARASARATLAAAQASSSTAARRIPLRHAIWE